MPFVTANGLNMYYEMLGSGPKVLVISGTGGDLRLRPGVQDAPINKHFSLLCYDQRGLGQTEKPDRPYTMRDYADDAAALMQAMDWGPCPVLGISFGGMVAQELTIRHPQLVTKLVLCCTSAGGAGNPSYDLRKLTDLDPDARLTKRIQLNHSARTPRWQRQHPDRVAVYKDRMNFGERFRDEPGWAMGRLQQLEARAGHDTYDRLPQINVPTLVCAGKYDGIASPANQQAFVDQIPNARLDWFDGGHLFMIEDKRAYQVIGDFLA